MKRCLFIFIAVLISAQPVFSAAAEIDEETKKAVKQAAMDYMDGAHAGDATRMERAVHPELTKVTIRRVPTGKDAVQKAGATRLIELIRADAAPLPEAERNIELEIHAVSEGIAAVEISSSMFCDYLLLAEIDGRWKIINVLWRVNPEWLKKKNPEALEGKEPPDEEADRKGIETAILDYLDGYFTGDAERMTKALHPELTKVWPKTDQKTGRPYLDKIGSSLLIEATAMGGGKMEAEKRDIRISILDYGEEIALVEALSAAFIDYIQIARVNGEWKIINVLWVMNPDAPKR